MDINDQTFDDLDTSLLRSPNDYPDSHTDHLSDGGSESRYYIPTGHTEVSKVPKQNSPFDPRDVLDLLHDAAVVKGVSVSAVMENTAVALAHRYGLEPSAMEWFIEGISFANNQMIMEKMAQSIKDLQIEVRNLQGASGSIKSNSEEFMSKIRANKNEITAEINKTRDTVLTALQDMRYPSSATVKPVVTSQVSIPVKDTTPPVPPQGINEALLSEALKTPIQTRSPEEMLIRRQEDFLLALGFELTDIEKIPSEFLELIIDKAWLDLDVDELTEENISALTDIALSNILECGVQL
ncbi:phosphoprotein [Alphacytorhabdovirus ribes]|nr:phosphoprotein [Black currant cytorhabdovirus 1]